MYKLGWFVMCERSIVDRDSNTVSLISSLDRVVSSDFPVEIAFTLATYWYKKKFGSHEPEELRTRYQLHWEGEDEPILLPEYCHSFDQPTVRLFNRLNPLSLSRPGRLWIVLEHWIAEQWHEQSRLPLEVVSTSELP